MPPRYDFFLRAVIARAVLVCLAAAVFSPSTQAQDLARPLKNKVLPQAEILKFRGFEPSARALERMAAAVEASRERKQALSNAQKKVSPLLRQVVERAGKGGAAGQAGRALQTGSVKVPLLRIDQNGNVQVEVRLRNLSALGTLRSKAVSIDAVNAEKRLVVASLPFEEIMGVAGLAAVKSIQPVLPGSVDTGSVVSEGIAALDVGEVRDVFGLDGKGVKVCAISDGTDGLAQAQTTGDLPSRIEICPLNTSSGAEGTAILEIVHDLAPGAELAFCPAFGDQGKQGLANAIAYLAGDAFGGQGCDVIVDDVAYLDEPYFQDGIVAQAVDAAAAQGVSYFTSAGNSAESHYMQRFVETPPGRIPSESIPLESPHDFGRAAGQESDIDWTGVVAGAGELVVAFLQWNDPFASSTNDYDLYLFDRLGYPAGDPEGLFPCYVSRPACFGANGTAAQFRDGDPLEVAFIVNPYGEVTPNTPFGDVEPFFIVIDRFFGDPDKQLEINFGGTFGFLEPYAVAEGSVWGHSAAEGAITVGAIDVNDDGLNDIEPFSSRGPSRIFFKPDGTPTFEVRDKPDVVAVDGVSVTGSGGFPTTFFGTSASAPHAAAIAALMLEHNPSLSPEAIKQKLIATALDRGEPGFDFVYGGGLVNAFEALLGSDTDAPNCRIVSIQEDILTVEVHDTGSGLYRIQPIKSENATLSIPSFAQGTQEAVTFLATKVDPKQRATVVVEAFDVAGNSRLCDPVVTRVSADVPVAFGLDQNYPNPFNPMTKIRFKLAEPGPVDLTVYDLLGREVASLLQTQMEAGLYEIEWDARDNANQLLPSGVYLYRLDAGTFSESRTMVLVK